MEYVKVNGVEYPASISGKLKDDSWDGRASKTIKFENNVMPYETALTTFVEGVAWSIISEWQEEQYDEEGNPYNPPQYITKRQEFDNSDYDVAGAITNKRDGGTVTVTMGKLTEIESLINDFYGGVN